MEYYVVDKCDKTCESYKLDIYSGRNSKVGAILWPTRYSEKCTKIYSTIDFANPVIHTLYDKEFECRKNKMQDNFRRLYVKDINISPYIVGRYSTYKEYSQTSDITYTHDKPLLKYYPKIVLSYTIATAPRCRPSECYEVNVDDKECIYSFKPDIFEDNIELHFTAHQEKNVTFSDKKSEKGRLKYTIDTRLSGSSRIIFNGEKYVFDSDNIKALYCLYKTTNMYNEISWTFICIATLQNIEKPTVTKVTEEQFKSLDKHDADIVICKDKTFLMKGTTNNNFIVNYSHESPSDLKRYVNIDYPECYLSTCRNCSNCYDCEYCLNCNNCEFSKSCVNCNTCTNCLNAFYCDNGIDIFNKSDISNTNTFKSNDYKYNDVDIYTKYVAQFNTKTTKSNKKMYVAIIATAVVTTLSIMGYIFLK